MSPASLARKISVASIVLLASATSQAAPLLPGGGLLTPAEPDPTGGTVLFTSGPVAFTGGGANGFSGTLTTTVIQDDPSNPFANIGNPNPLLHGLTFTYLLHNNATSKTALERLNTVDFSTFATDVSYQPGAGQVPSITDRSINAGAVIGWDFTGVPDGLGTLMPGSTSTLLVVQTNAPAYDISQAASVIDGATASIPEAGPSLSTISPEPASLSLLLAGGLGLKRRRRN
jgi:hypothetical protein